ncbi:nucleotidyltransferase domain-containing protein [Pyrobaculum aerophilum]|uniref:DNA polymerase subunit beta n=1 Tax=Pyrobaculum aerophilum TaxID=13773 RepID=A0A371QY27_9CREN|nr:nucleotidyltransferase domain-containing protein [Pyrobaculum aerophilum]RFA95593.1 DNA polymerase subunit beta [Pyrobaculum aerophilum]RFA99162.1 DNA polymerase subunit beta [Pyrobaculum aerophilum]
MVWEILAQRVREYPERFSKCLASIIQRYGGQVTVVLFGSRASGRHSASSDFDVIIIVPQYGDYFEEAAEIKRLCRGVPLDAIIFARDELKIEGVVAKMLEDCVALYDGLSLNICKKKVQGDVNNKPPAARH